MKSLHVTFNIFRALDVHNFRTNLVWVSTWRVKVLKATFSGVQFFFGGEGGEGGGGAVHRSLDWTNERSAMRTFVLPLARLPRSPSSPSYPEILTWCLSYGIRFPSKSKNWICRIKEVQINFESEEETVYRELTHDVTSAILESYNNETAAILLFQTNPV